MRNRENVGIPVKNWLHNWVKISSWASGGNLNTARQRLAGAGTQTAGLCMGGYSGSDSAVTEEYNCDWYRL